ncbi:hypothetical protein GXW74_17810 [Roseomonas eburnea]|uniref:DUF4239 domain-containing protein n=1 Tax=Neoroseomonas eburnea TaxID=1346889 RepID=A0A9X9XF66_9PROT|nr:hypothetical protein [Neoroseomonas eburnea]
MTEFVIEIARLGALPFAGVLFILQMVSREFGLWMGQHRAAKRAGEPEGVGVIVGGMLGLLAFVLALTLSFASARFQERREGTLAEANAIGTAWLRAVAIDHPRAAEVARLLETYAPVRREHVLAPLDAERLAEIQARSDTLQGEIWGHVSALVRERSDPVAASLMAAVNDVIDQSAVERLAFATGMPPTLFWLLIGMTFVSMGGLGYQLGLRGLQLRALSVVLIMMWTVVMTAILDLGSPRLGDVRTSTAPYDWTIQGFAGGLRIPPLPPPR